MGMLSSLLFFNAGLWPSRAADRLEVEIDDVVLPVKVSDLGTWVRSEGKSRSELNTWLMLLDEDSRAGLMRLLEAPVLTRRSLGQQILRSWAAGPLLDALRELIRVEGSRPVSSEEVLATLESLLHRQKSVSTLDLLEALPSERLRLDLDALVLAAARWRRQMERHQRLTSNLASSRSVSRPLDQQIQPRLDRATSRYPTSARPTSASSMNTLQLHAAHRPEGLGVQRWMPPHRPEASKGVWVLLMPGLGGDPEHFHWLARALAEEGWPVAVLEHPGSDAAAVQALLEGRQPFLGAKALRQRVQDMDVVIRSQRSGALDIPGERVVLIGHSLGALTALLATGITPMDGLSDRCSEALEDLPLTNLSVLLQCELAAAGVLKSPQPVPSVQAVVGLNSFGSLIWPSSRAVSISQPLLLMGGTLDLITPPLSEQLELLDALGSHPASRAVIVEGASHFSPIRVEGQPGAADANDLFRLSEELVGVQPLMVQQLMMGELLTFLRQVEMSEPMGESEHLQAGSIRWHRLNRRDARGLVERSQ